MFASEKEVEADTLGCSLKASPFTLSLTMVRNNTSFFVFLDVFSTVMNCRKPISLAFVGIVVEKVVARKLNMF
ncbi:MAG: hypothetical protein Q9N02_06830 [Ghiorsea sp.]|nr:hypothetical protein [Ghiorsea sp.]